MILSFISFLVILLFCHFLADYPLQGDFLARAKNHRDPITHVSWQHALFAHAFIHAGMVLFVTESVIAFVGELIAHAWIDYRKCDGELSFEQDQYLHIGCKVMWAFLVTIGL